MIAEIILILVIIYLIIQKLWLSYVVQTYNKNMELLKKELLELHKQNSKSKEGENE